MLEIKLTGVPCETFDLAAIAKQTAHYSGADIDGLIELAKEAALEDNIVNGRERDADRRRLHAGARQSAALDASSGCAPRATS